MGNMSNSQIHRNDGEHQNLGRDYNFNFTSDLLNELKV